MNQTDNTILKNYPDVMTISEVSKILSISEKTAYKLIRSGAIQHLTIGRSYRIPKVYLVEYILQSA